MPLIECERYEIESTSIGKGGFGEVYRALDLLTEEVVVIKTVIASHLYGINEPEIRRKFFREAVVAARLGARSKNIVAVRDFGYDRDSSMPFFVMDYVEGNDLSDDIGKTQPEKAANVLFQILLALEVAHDSGVVHSDISPDNILAEPATRYLKLNDFGLARLLTSQIATRGRTFSLVGGKPGYLPPMDWQTGERTFHSDLFGLAATVLELVTGAVPTFQWNSGVLTGPNLWKNFSQKELSSIVIDYTVDEMLSSESKDVWIMGNFVRRLLNKSERRAILKWEDIVKVLQAMLDDETQTVKTIIEKLRNASLRNAQAASGKPKPKKGPKRAG